MSKPIRVLIADDESLGRERIRQLLSTEPDIEIVGECENGVQTVETVEQLAPDLLYLDVQMPDLDGVGVLNELGRDRIPEVIFTTAHPEYMETAFEAHALDYLKKPFSETRFRHALDHARERIAARRALPSAGDARLQAFLAEITAERTKTRLKIVERSGELRLLPTDEVFCLEADEDHVKVHAGKETLTWRTTLAHASESLDPGVFLRVHRSYIVNTGRVRKVTRIGKGEYFFELENGRKVGTGRIYREAVEAFINR